MTPEGWILMAVLDWDDLPSDLQYLHVPGEPHLMWCRTPGSPPLPPEETESMREYRAKHAGDNADVNAHHSLKRLLG